VRVTQNHNFESVRPVLEGQYPLVASRVQRGRPNWDDFFCDVKSEFEGKENVKIFCCGSETLMQELDFRTSVISSGNTKFQLIREAYS
jgi:Ferric reductase NAD binding domain